MFTSADSLSSFDDEDTGLLSSLCPYCNTNAPIYTCPRCFARTCSVPCNKKHKLYRQCNGIRDPTAYVKRSRLMTESSVNRDYTFLTGLEKQIASPMNPSAGTIVDRAQTKIRIQELLRAKHTTVKWAPWEGFKRAVENKTRAVPKCNNNRRSYVRWTVEWMLVDLNDRKILDHEIPENVEVRTAFFSPMPPDPLRKTIQFKSSTDFYLLLEAPANKKRCVKLDAMKSWAENLRERTVIEFPQVLVTARKPENALIGWEVMRDERKIVELNIEDEEAQKGANRKKRKPKSSGQKLQPLSTSTQKGINGETEVGEAPASDKYEVPVLEKRKLEDDIISNTLAAIKKARKT